MYTHFRFKPRDTMVGNHFSPFSFEVTFHEASIRLLIKEICKKSQIRWQHMRHEKALYNGPLSSLSLPTLPTPFIVIFHRDIKLVTVLFIEGKCKCTRYHTLPRLLTAKSSYK